MTDGELIEARDRLRRRDQAVRRRAEVARQHADVTRELAILVQPHGAEAAAARLRVDGHRTRLLKHLDDGRSRLRAQRKELAAQRRRLHGLE